MQKQSSITQWWSLVAFVLLNCVLHGGGTEAKPVSHSVNKLKGVVANNLFSLKQANLSANYWQLPEEGSGVFYRFFRDKISWFEADAVCQFHHGNLVTGACTPFNNSLNC